MRRSMAIISCMFMIISGMIVTSTFIEGQNDTRLDPIDDPELPPIGFFKGILPMPADNESLDSAYLNASSHSQFVPIWGRPSPFYNLSDDLGGWWGDTFVDGLVRDNGMFPLIHMNFFKKDGGHLVVDSPGNISSPSLNNTDWRNTYKKAAMDVLATERPRYFSIGNEVNRWFEEHGATDPDNGFHLYVSLYEEIYSDLKAVSPETQVFCTFSREMVSDGREANLSVLELFNSSRMDLLMFTTYPYALPSVSEPADIPDNYYMKAFDHIDEMRIGFSEIGWSSDPFFGGEQGQVDLIENITGRLTRGQGLSLHMLAWVWLTDLPGGDQTGLRYRNGTDKLGLEAWRMNEPPSYNSTGRQIFLLEDFGTHIIDLSTIFHDPDPWDRLKFTVWNGTDWTGEMATNVEISIDGYLMELRSIDNVTGSRMFQVRVEDWSGEANVTFFQVSLTDMNDAPVYLGGFEPIVFLEDHIVNLDLVPIVDDVDDLPYSLSIEVLNSPWLKVTGSRLSMVIQTLEYDWYGDTFILFRIVDTRGLYVEVNRSVNVIAVNDPPEMEGVHSVSMEEDGDHYLNVSGWGSDIEGDPLEWSVFNPNPELLEVTLSGTEIYFKPAQDWSGQVSITLTLSDGTDSINRTFVIDVGSVNDVPTFDQPPLFEINEDEIFTFDLDTLDPVDQDGDRIFWVVGEYSPLIRTATVLEDHMLRIQPVNNGNGMGWVNMSLVDQPGARMDRGFSISVAPLNDPPLFIVGDSWEVDMRWGGSIEFDLGLEPFIVEDLDSEMDTLVVVTKSQYCTTSGLLVNLTLPSGYRDEEIEIYFTIRDDQGGISEPGRLTVRIEGDRTVGSLNITLMDILDKEGRFVLRALGGPGQIIWAVFSDGTSHRLIESEHGSYDLVLKDLNWEDGQVVSVHLSMTEEGPNDTIFPASEFTYKVPPKEDEQFPTLAMILLGMVILGVAIILFATFKKGNADELKYDAAIHEE